MKRYKRSLSVVGVCCAFFISQAHADDIPSQPLPQAAAETLRFDITSYLVEGATLLNREEIDAAVAPFVGKGRDFSDVQFALKAVEQLYVKHGYSAVHVLLPEQELASGVVRIKVVEGRFSKITVLNNRFASNNNVLNALPSLRSGGVPRSDQVSRELELANENPSRQLNVVLNAGKQDDEVDASVLVTDSKPSVWSLTVDNSGTSETGLTRTSVAYRNADVFDADHVATAQFQTSPADPSRVLVLGGSYKIPRYQSGDSVEFFGGYSNVNSLVGGLTNFQGGGSLLSVHDNKMLGHMAGFDQKLTFGLDWRKFNTLTQTQPATVVLYNEIVATPLSVAISGTRKTVYSDSNFNLSFLRNLPVMGNGRSADFTNYDPSGLLMPDANYSVLRYDGSYARSLEGDWRLRAAFNGQWSDNVLILGEQLRLGGANGVRGFAEGSEGGERGELINLEAYTPSKDILDFQARGLVFYDAGTVSSSNGYTTFIDSAGVGVRATHEQLSLRADMGWILNPGADPLYHKGDWRIHAGISVAF
jgi:hemolysin activation/secretion protein